MGQYAEKTVKLRETALENVRFGTDTVSGEIRTDENKLLCLAIPFSKGWNAYIDGDKAEVHCLNGRYIGVVVPTGVHNVRFHYIRPYQNIGYLISAAGIAAFLFIIIAYSDKRKRAELTGKNMDF